MAVTVKIPTQLRSVTGGESEAQVDDVTTVGEVLDGLYDRFDGLRDRIAEDGDLRRFVNVYVGGEDIRFPDGRVHRAADRLAGGTFCLTYADGLADIDLSSLLDFHRSHGRAATMTVVRPRNPWGVAQLRNDGRVDGFEEKPRLDSWVNGGFFVMEPAALGFIGADDVLERDPLESLAGAGELFAYRHEGFWDCMDTYKDTLLLNELWDRGRAPWRELVGA